MRIMNMARDAVARVENSDDTQWVVVCMDADFDPPVVYAAWDTQEEAAAWLNDDHLPPDGDGREFEPVFCSNGSSDMDHYVVSVIDTSG